MTIKKSLKYEVIETGGHVHRVHRAMKNRRPNVHTLNRKKKKIEQLRLRERLPSIKKLRK